MYAHFPINVVKAEGGENVLEVRNFMGERIVRHVSMLDGVQIKDIKNNEITLEGNNIENVSGSGACIFNSNSLECLCHSPRRMHGADQLECVPHSCPHSPELLGPEQGYPKVLGRHLRV